MASLLLKDICKVYPGDVQAVSDFNLEIADREFIVFVGPSGCGKSTTLRMIAGLEDITGGELYIGESLMNHVEPGKRNVAMVFQNYALYPHLTVYENMAFGLKIRKVPRKEIDTKVNEVARTLDIAHLLGRKPKALSGGERQRVALGRAIIREPDVFLLDEPLSNLDAKLRAQMRTEISKLHQRLGTTFVYVTHDQVEAMTMGNRICVMKDGFIQQADTPQNIYGRPANLFVAGFIGSPQMNFMDATLRKSPDAYYLELSHSAHARLAVGERNSPLSSYIDRPVVIGVRPEHLEIGRAAAGSGAAIAGTVEIVEMMGAETYVYVDCGELSLRVRFGGEAPVNAGEQVRVAVNESKIHIFDPETGVRIP